MNVTKLIEMLQAAGCTADAAAFERVDLIAFFEAYKTAIEDEAPGRDDIEREIKALLAEGNVPEYRVEDDRGLELDEYVQFFQDVLTRLLLNRFARIKPLSDSCPVRLHGNDEDRSAAGLLDRKG